MLTSKRALSTENGFSKNPTATRVVAPARRFPWLVSVGSTDPFAFGGALERTRAKCAERAISVRSCVSEVMYMATPGTFLRAQDELRTAPMQGTEDVPCE